MLEKINQDIKDALKNKESFKLALLRQISAAIKNEEIALKKQETGLSSDEAMAVLKREAKKRKDAISSYTAGNRQDLADGEQKELDILNSYLPEEISPEEIRKVVKQIIEKMGQVSQSQFGQVMGRVMAELKGNLDGALVNKIVKEEINNK